jgi:hypothetical protein
MGDNKNQLRAMDFNKLWLMKAPEAVVEKVERPFPWPEPPQKGDPYRTPAPRPPCDGCNHASYAIQVANDAHRRIDVLRRKFLIWVFGLVWAFIGAWLALWWLG